MADGFNDNYRKRPEVLECDVVRFQNAKDKWVAFVGLLDGKPYEIFTGLQDDDDAMTSSSRTVVAIRPQSRGCRRNSILSIGTMPS